MADETGSGLLQALKDEVKTLDAAMLLALADPAKGPVHELRTATRRVQAQLLLLETLPAAEHRRASGADALPRILKDVRDRLRDVRRAAGAVRDLDVQRDLIADDAPARSGVTKGSVADDLRKEAKQLRRMLKKRRETEAAGLAETLRREEKKLAGAMRQLEQALQPAEGSVGYGTGLAADTMLMHVERWFQSQAPHGRTQARDNSRPPQPMSEKGLHEVRKAAKLCRYMAESVPMPSRETRQVAQKFEAIQDAGGRWHDWLLLQQLAQHLLGKHSALAERYGNHAQAALADYELRLDELLSQVTAAIPKRSRTARNVGTKSDDIAAKADGHASGRQKAASGEMRVAKSRRGGGRNGASPGEMKTRLRTATTQTTGARAA